LVVTAVHEACKEVFRSRKLKRLLELVLACGNYMNRGQRGNALGFQPASLNKMVDTRSSASKHVTLLHYVVDTLEKKVRLLGELFFVAFFFAIPYAFNLLKIPCTSVCAQRFRAIT
jgi:hypothetical protein